MLVSGIFLCAGLSTRMGHQKLLLPFGGGTVVEASLENFLALEVDEAIIVTGQDKLVEELISKRLELFSADSNIPVKLLRNPEPGRGQASSVIIGVEGASTESAGYLVFLGDMPLTIPEIVNVSIEGFRREPDRIIVPLHKGRRGNPVILPSSFKEELTSQTGDYGGREIIKWNGDKILYVESPSKFSLYDMDDLDAYREISRLGYVEREKMFKTLLSEGDVKTISLSGGGGKTSLMIYLSELLGHDGRSLMTTTTKILAPAVQDYGTDNIVREEAFSGDGRGKALEAAISEASDAGSPLLLLGEKAAGGRKYTGTDPEVLKAARDSNLFRSILMETDGSNGRPVKVAGKNEPVIPPYTDVCIAVLGMSALGMPVDENAIHRLSVFKDLFPDHVSHVDMDLLIELANRPEGFFREAPEGSLKILLCNQWDLLDKDLRSMVRRALIGGIRTADYLVLSSLKGENKIVDFYHYH